MSTKANISKILLGLKKFGYEVKSFGSNKALRKGQTGFVDNLIFNNYYLIFVETKCDDTKDKFSDAQKKTAQMLSSISTLNRTVHYRIIRNIKEAQKLFDLIIERKL
jgi:hypothetical protein